MLRFSSVPQLAYIVFKTGGTISLTRLLPVVHDYCTIAGQTAPGDGICLKNYALNVEADHVIVRYLRSRPGDTTSVNGLEVDALEVTDAHDVIIDHCSTSWGTDENLSIGGTQATYVTVQNCLISEALRDDTKGRDAVWRDRPQSSCFCN